MKVPPVDMSSFEKKTFSFYLPITIKSGYFESAFE